jgi:hypothetical protein
LHHVGDIRAYLYISARNPTLKFLKILQTSESSPRTRRALTSFGRRILPGLLHTETIRALRATIEAAEKARDWTKEFRLMDEAKKDTSFDCKTFVF